jgi:hypothetical protein
MNLFGLNVEKSKRSLLLRDELSDLIKEKFNLNLGYCFNDLYSVKGGVVRRLKGWMSDENNKGMELDELNNKFNEVKEFLESLNIEGFDIKFNKLGSYSFDGDNGWGEYFKMKDNGFEGDFLDFKNKLEFEERVIILKIKWKI